jgi:S-adenosylmethionine decarboxylase
MALVRDLAPEIFRQRHLIEGRFTVDLDDAAVRGFLTGLAGALGATPYGDPIVFSPDGMIGKGQGSAGNAGYDAFLPLVDSGISAYFWTVSKFFSVVIYTCKGFDPDAGLAFTRDALGVTGEIVHAGF